MEDSRQKRTHRACAPCRRKKVKCSGERPICSFCQRLGQPCEYGTSEHYCMQDAVCDGKMASRVEAMDRKLDQVLQLLSHTKIQSSSVAPVRSSPTSGPLQQQSDIQLSIPARAESLYSGDYSLLEAGQLYQTWCHNQPLYLFRQERFLETLQQRDEELRLAIQALSYRFRPTPLTSERQQTLEVMSKSSRRLIMDCVANGNIKLSTLQSLCILNGNVMQAGLDLGMAHYFAGNLPRNSSLGDPLECSLCVEAISLLQSLQESIPDPSRSVSIGGLFKNASYLLELFNYRSNKISPPRDLAADGDEDYGILFYVAQAAEVWHMARAYATVQVGADDPPPWNPDSDYSLVMLRHLELDSQFPLRYRFATNNFGGLTPEALHQRRDYWSPWLFIQFVHAAIPALLNHPFLLSMRLKNFRHKMPQTFMHQSFDHISRHTAWIICFLDLIEKQQFQVTDPLIAHCVAIFATIHLQHSFVKDDALRKKAQNGYGKCMQFLERMGSMWPSVFNMAQNLRKLRDSITTLPINNHQDTQQDENHVSWSIDAQLLWDILIYQKAGRENASADRSMFVNATTLEADRQEQDVAEFAMVGSAGISGHKKAWKEISAYAPEDNERQQLFQTMTTPTGAILQPAHTADDRLFEGLVDMNMIDQGDLLLQAEDFGRAMNDWINFDMADVS